MFGSRSVRRRRLRRRSEEGPQDGAEEVVRKERRTGLEVGVGAEVEPVVLLRDGPGGGGGGVICVGVEEASCRLLKA
jgi:hypothetical protein